MTSSWHLLALVVVLVAPGGLARDVDCIFPYRSNVPQRCDLYEPFFGRNTWQLRDCPRPFDTTACDGTVNGNILHGTCTDPVAYFCAGTLSPRAVKCVDNNNNEVMRCAPAGELLLAGGAIPATNTATEEAPRGPRSCNASGAAVSAAAPDAPEGITPVFAPPPVHADGWLECAVFAGKCAKAAYQAYEKKDIHILFACASLKTICGCATSVLPFPIGPFIHDKFCGLTGTGNAAETPRRGPSPLQVDAALASGGTCPPNWERIPANGQQCYSPSCPPGYNLIDGAGDDVAKYCWKDCDLGWTDNGITCSVSLDTYGKGCCCTLWGCCHNCRPTYTDMGCTCSRSHKEFTKDNQARDTVPVQY